ncbi:MAG: DUF2339 domain-containing protein [Betaproteobacteria bacterium]|nr:DUF2339 domain-containing protein [Betaproteobacteria bacterium]
MWLIGMLLGALAFGIAGDGSAAVLGGLLGGVLAHRLAADRKSLRALEARLSDLETRSRRATAPPADTAADAAQPEARALAATPATPPTPAPRATVAPDADDDASAVAQTPSYELTPAELFARLAQGENVEVTAASSAGTSSPSASTRGEPQPAYPPAAHTSPSSADHGVAHPPAAGDRWDRAVLWLTRGNVVARAGALILFVGLAFLMQLVYTAVTPAARLGGAALGGAALLAAGWRMRHTRPGYAVSLQGAGVAILYLTVYGALRLFGMVDAPLAFALMALVAAASAALAVRQDSVALAVLGFGGGFLAPLLASTGSGSHVVLFGYYTLVNAGLAAVAWNRAWRPLTFTGFALTFGAAGLWGWKFFQPHLYASTQPFLLLFFAIYLALQVRFALLRAPRWTDLVDASSVFGVPLVGFGLQASLVKDFEHGTAISAAVLALLYLVLAARMRRRGSAFGMLADAYNALGTGFLVLAVPLAVDARWTAAAWALQGAGLVWVALRNQRRLVLVMGLGLQLAAACTYAVAEMQPEPGVAVLNRVCLGAVLLAVAALFSAWRLEQDTWEAGERDADPIARPGLAWALLIWGLFWWIFAGLREISQHVPRPDSVPTALLFALLSATAFQAAYERLRWQSARWPALSLPVAMTLALLVLWKQPQAQAPLAGAGLFAWPAVWLTHLALLTRHDNEPPDTLAVLHAAVPACMAVVLGWHLDLWLLDALGSNAWSVIGWALPAAALLALVTYTWRRREDASQAPGAVEEGWLLLGGALLTAGLLGWSLLAGLSKIGAAPPLPWWPVINVLDLAVLLLPLLALPWLRAIRARFTGSPIAREASRLPVALSVLGFINLNTALLRDFALVLGFQDWGEMLRQSSEVQAGLSLLWTTVALTAMWTASRRGARAPWIAGASLMAVVVAKLLLVDLSNVGTFARIVSFVGVGALMLLMGWVSPLPPEQGTEDSQDKAA